MARVALASTETQKAEWIGRDLPDKYYGAGTRRMDALAGTHQIDHVIIGVADLASGVDEFRRLTGVTPIAGGVHPGRGTHNALAALDQGRYLEILAALPGAPPSEALSALRRLKTLTPCGWAVSTYDADASAEFLKDAGFEVSPRAPGSRLKADGAKLEWSTFDVGPDLQLAPFFISWSASSRHPSVDSPPGCSLASIVIELPVEAASRQLLELLAVGVELKTAKAARMEITLQCPKGTVHLGQGVAWPWTR